MRSPDPDSIGTYQHRPTARLEATPDGPRAASLQYRPFRYRGLVPLASGAVGPLIALLLARLPDPAVAEAGRYLLGAGLPELAAGAVLHGSLTWQRLWVARPSDAAVVGGWHAFQSLWLRGAVLSVLFLLLGAWVGIGVEYLRTGPAAQPLPARAMLGLVVAPVLVVARAGTPGGLALLAAAPGVGVGAAALVATLWQLFPLRDRPVRR
ncbi:MAG: hypothetical protein FJX77_01880 [Armatimonadetes bacterium]|nr:hypothetical protein [Armatimonadota bacterium]